MSQILTNVKFEDECYTIIFITVSSHNGATFSFLNQPNNRMEFFWNRWSKWRDTLQPYTTHAFLIHAWSSKSESGMNFAPVLHLCEFLNQKEARVFNAAYLLHYNKLYEEGNVPELNKLSEKFGAYLQDMEDLREHWTDLCAQAAGAIMNNDLFEAFGLTHMNPQNMNKPWEADIIIDDFEPFDFFVVDE